MADERVSAAVTDASDAVREAQRLASVVRDNGGEIRRQVGVRLDLLRDTLVEFSRGYRQGRDAEAARVAAAATLQDYLMYQVEEAKGTAAELRDAATAAAADPQAAFRRAEEAATELRERAAEVAKSAGEAASKISHAARQPAAPGDAAATVTLSAAAAMPTGDAAAAAGGLAAAPGASSVEAARAAAEAAARAAAEAAAAAKAAGPEAALRWAEERTANLRRGAAGLAVAAGEAVDVFADAARRASTEGGAGGSSSSCGSASALAEEQRAMMASEASPAAEGRHDAAAAGAPLLESTSAEAVAEVAKAAAQDAQHAGDGGITATPDRKAEDVVGTADRRGPASPAPSSAN
ncbi:unnamed protein product [Phaeothamnion confervicola]